MMLSSYINEKEEHKAHQDQIEMTVNPTAENSDNKTYNTKQDDEPLKTNRVDPLGITYLRVRGMWGIENPMKVFNYIYQRDDSKNLNFMALINNEKYATFRLDTVRLEQLATEIDSLNIADVEIRTPDNPAILKQAKLISFQKLSFSSASLLTKQLQQDHRKRAEYYFGFQGIYQSLIKVTVLGIMAVVLGILKPMLFVILAFTSLRFFAGGTHMGTYLKCFLITVLNGFNACWNGTKQARYVF